MLIFTFIIPVITCIILLLGFRNYTLWWEYLIVLFPSILLSLILYEISVSSKTSDIEYRGYYVEKIEYYEDWDEYIHKTCTRTIKEGDRTVTISYDCSYVQYHPECWKMVLNDEQTLTIPEQLYNKILKKFKVQPYFVDLKRHYHSNDGDKYVCDFDHDRNKLYPITIKHSYSNKILGSRSLFNFSEVPDSVFDQEGLKDYPTIDLYDQNSIISDVPIPSYVIDSFNILNALYGEDYKFRVYLYIFKGKEQSIAKLEQDFLVGGNNNELSICIGTKDGKTIDWVESFSWEDNPAISVGVNHLYHSGDSLDLLVLNRYLFENVPKKWVCKDFKKDFNYLTTELSQGNWIFIFVFICIVNILLSVYVIKNEFY